MAHDTNDLAVKYRTSGLTQKNFCAKHRISISKLHYHLYTKKRQSTGTRPRFISLPAPVERSPVMATIAIIRGSFTLDQISSIINAGARR